MRAFHAARARRTWPPGTVRPVVPQGAMPDGRPSRVRWNEDNLRDNERRIRELLVDIEDGWEDKEDGGEGLVRAPEEYLDAFWEAWHRL